jgi:hypothetical protein
MMIRVQHSQGRGGNERRRDPFVVIRSGETCSQARIRHRRETGYMGACVMVFGGNAA